MAVLNLVAAIVSAYQEGSELLLSVKERRWACGTAHLFQSEETLMQDLELSLAKGADLVHGEYERDFKRLGANFASGDQSAIDSLNDIVIYMQKRLVSNLKIAWQQDTHVDYFQLQDVSDDAQDRALMCLMHLHQRLLAAAPFDRSQVPHQSRPGHTSFSSLARGAPQAYIDPPPPRASDSQPFGNPTVTSRPASDFSTNSNQRHGSQRSRDDSMAGEPRIQHVSSVTSDFIPIEFHRDEHFFDPRQQDHFQDHAAGGKEYRPDQRFDDSPTLSPARIDSVGSLSSCGSRDPDDPEFNPWSTSGSPISSFPGSASPVPKSPYAPSLVPDALSPRRQDTERGFYQPQEASLDESLYNLALRPPVMPPQPPPANQANSHARYANQSYRTPPNMAPSGRSQFQDNDDASIYSQDTNSNTPNYTQQSSADPSQLDSYFPSPPSNPARRNPTYGLFPSQSPAREIMRSPPPSQRSLQARLPTFQQPAHPPPSIPLPRAPAREQNYSPIPAHKWVGQRAPPTAPLPPTPSSGPERLPERYQDRYQERFQERIPDRIPEHYVPEPIPERSPDRIPERIPERAPARLTALTTTSMSSSSSAGMSNIGSVSNMTLQTPLSTHSSFHLANRRISTVSSSNSSTSGSRAMPATKVVPSAGMPGNVKSCLPSEANKFAGFCKGAWRGQIGDKKKAYDERSRPAGISSNKVFNFYKCKKCNFEGRAIKLPGQKKAQPDSKVFGSNGVLYRWEFLFKSHLESKVPHQNPVDSTYGCMFCCAQGRGTPVFTGVASLLAHLQEHREVLPEGEIVYRMNAIVGRSPDPDEDFDVALPSLVL